MADKPHMVDGLPVYFRGFAMLRAMLTAMLRPEGPGGELPSLAKASSLLLSGSSAGGLAVYLHADYISDTVHAANPSCVVKAVPEAGFFPDAASIWPLPHTDVERPQYRHVMSEVFSRLAGFANITGGAPDQVSAACVAATEERDRWRCFSAQYTLPFIRTPLFVVNSMHDQWQAQHMLAPDPNVSYGVTSYAPFRPCIKAPLVGCNATQAAQWTAYADQFMDLLASARAATPPPLAAQHAGVITSCPIHDTLMNGLSRRIVVRGSTLYDRVAAWVLEEPGTAGVWTVDVPFPGNPTCPMPTADDE